MCLRLIAETDTRSVGDSHPSCIYCKAINSGGSIYYIILAPLILAFLLAGVSNTLKYNEILNISDPLFSRCHQGHEIKVMQKIKVLQ